MIAPALVFVRKYPPPLVESCRMAAYPEVVALPAPFPKVIFSRPVFGEKVPFKELVGEPACLSRVLLVIAIAKSNPRLVLEIVSAADGR